MKSDIISLALIISVILILVGFLLSSGILVQKNTQLSRYIEEDLYNYQNFLYYPFVYTPYLIRTAFFNYFLNIYFPNENYNDIITENPQNIYENCQPYYLYNYTNIYSVSQEFTNLIKYNPCIALYPMSNYQEYTNLSILSYIENFMSNYKIPYLSSISIDTSNFLINVSYNYTYCPSKEFCRTFNIEIPYSIVPYMFLYDNVMSQVYFNEYNLFVNNFLLNELFYNNSDFKHTLSIYNEIINSIGPNSPGLDFGVSIPSLFYLYNFTINQTLFLLPFSFKAINWCEEIGGYINQNGQCQIQYNSQGDPLAYECLNPYPNDTIINNPSEFIIQNGLPYHDFNIYIISNITYCDSILYSDGLCNLPSQYSITSLIQSSIYPELPDDIQGQYLGNNQYLQSLCSYINNFNNIISQYNIYSENYEYPIMVPSIVFINQSEINCQIGYIKQSIPVLGYDYCSYLAQNYNNNFFYKNPNCENTNQIVYNANITGNLSLYVYNITFYVYNSTINQLQPFISPFFIFGILNGSYKSYHIFRFLSGRIINEFIIIMNISLPLYILTFSSSNKYYIIENIYIPNVKITSNEEIPEPQFQASIPVSGYINIGNYNGSFSGLLNISLNFSTNNISGFLQANFNIDNSIGELNESFNGNIYQNNDTFYGTSTGNETFYTISGIYENITILNGSLYAPTDSFPNQFTFDILNASISDYSIQLTGLLQYLYYFYYPPFLLIIPKINGTLYSNQYSFGNIDSGYINQIRNMVGGIIGNITGYVINGSIEYNNLQTPIPEFKVQLPTYIYDLIYYQRGVYTKPTGNYQETLIIGLYNVYYYEYNPNLNIWQIYSPLLNRAIYNCTSSS